MSIEMPSDTRKNLRKQPGKIQKNVAFGLWPNLVEPQAQCCNG